MYVNGQNHGRSLLNIAITFLYLRIFTKEISPYIYTIDSTEKVKKNFVIIVSKKTLTGRTDMEVIFLIWVFCKSLLDEIHKTTLSDI